MGKAEEAVRAQLAKKEADELARRKAERQREEAAKQKAEAQRVALESVIREIAPRALEELEKHGFPGGELKQFGTRKRFLGIKYVAKGPVRACWRLNNRKEIYLASTGQLAWPGTKGYFWGVLDPSRATLCAAFMGLHELAPEVAEEAILASGLLEDGILRDDLGCSRLYDDHQKKAGSASEAAS